MIPQVALDLRDDRLTVLTRREDGEGWWHEGSVAFSDAAMRDETAELARRAAERVGDGFASLVILPEDQILYASFERDDRPAEETIRASLRGRTPYEVGDLAFDHARRGDRLQVAVVALETLLEAETFAADRGFRPVGFVADPDRAIYPGIPFFGRSGRADSFLAGEALEIPFDGFDARPAPPLPAAPTVAFATRRQAGDAAAEITAPPRLSMGAGGADAPARAQAARRAPPAERARGARPARLSAIPAAGPAPRRAASGLRLMRGGRGLVVSLALLAVCLLVGLGAWAMRAGGEGEAPSVDGGAVPAVVEGTAHAEAPEPAPAVPAEAPRAPPERMAPILVALPQPGEAVAEDAAPPVAPTPVARPPAAAPPVTAPPVAAPPVAAPPVAGPLVTLTPVGTPPEPEAVGEATDAPVPAIAAPEAPSPAEDAESRIAAADPQTIVSDAAAPPAPTPLGPPEAEAEAAPPDAPADDVATVGTAPPDEAPAAGEAAADAAPVPTAQGARTAEGHLLRAGRPDGLIRARPDAGARAELTRRARAAEAQARRALLADSRPTPRPREAAVEAAPPEIPTDEEAQAVALAAQAALAGIAAEVPASAIARSERPDSRPPAIAERAARAAQAAPAQAAPTQAAAPTRQPEPQAPAPAARAAAPQAAPSIPTRSNVARAATERNVVRMNRISLIGVYGTPQSRRALVRLGNGRYVKVEVGDRLDSGRVVAIGADALRYQRGGRNIVLSMPQA
jgi:hypothetical protein